MRTRTLLTGSACALLLSCSSPTGMCACPPARSHGVVHGSVRSAAGQPIAGVQLQATVFRSICGEGPGEVHPEGRPAASDASGAYRLHVYSLYGERAVCVRVTALSPGGADSSMVHAALALRSERVQPDSVRVDLVLP
ncbi:MAG TPA: hypothetical protein VGR37_20365 [Longimicrobiaceae bacterium]|nr:hypothetical protein [Longimicrobiaceae bacterium]